MTVGKFPLYVFPGKERANQPGRSVGCALEQRLYGKPSLPGGGFLGQLPAPTVTG